MLLTAEAIVTGRKVLRPGWLAIDGGAVTGIGSGIPTEPVTHELGSVTVIPGFVDTHVHGGNGFDFSTATLEATNRAVELHRRHGTTRMLASLVTAGADDLLGQVAHLARHAQAGLIAGIHLEGPWLATSRCGAHDSSLLRIPTRGEVDRLLDAGAGAIAMITLAPELPGALEAIERIVESGVVAAVGHTDASYQQTVDAVTAGATVGTHLFNAMRPIHHREPGPIVALLEDPRVTVEFIGDGVHVSPALYRHVNSFGTQNISLITDAMSACGAGDGMYRLGSLSVQVRSNIATIAGTETIAGSTATMDQVFRFAMTHSRLSLDEALLVAVQQTSVNPARALRLSSSTLAVGEAADFLVLDSELQIRDVYCGGDRITAAG